MGLQRDLCRDFKAPKTLKCPKCSKKTTTLFNDYDIECGEPFPKPGKIELTAYCQHCEAEILWRATIQAEPDPLRKLCRKFVKDNRITCPETVHQCDWVAENSPEFIAEICKIVGFHKERG